MKRKTMIIHNRCKCKLCGDIIESVSRHDFECCKCFKDSNGATGCFTDGGHDYIRRGGSPEHIENMDEVRLYTDEERDLYNKRQKETCEQYGFEYDPME